MNGRQENSIKTESQIKKMINNQPDIIKNYYDFISDKTHNTKLAYIKQIKMFINYLNNNNFNIEDTNSYKNIKSSDIRKYMNDIKYKIIIKDGQKEVKELSSSYRTLQLSAISSFFDFLIENEYIEFNPCSKVKLVRSKEDKKITYLTPNEVAILKDNIKYGVGTNRAKAKQANWYERDMALIHLLLHTGLRVTALTEINVDDIDLNNNIIRVIEKENFTRDIYIDDITNKYIADWLIEREKMLRGWDETTALFISNRRTRITPLTVNDLIKKYTYNIDKKITPHKLRATFATTVYNSTGDIYLTSNLIGHSSIETTKRYANIADEQRKTAIDALSDIY